MAVSSRKRSPGYPYIGLNEAIQRVSGIYKRDYQASLTRNLAAERLGYSGLNGSSEKVLAALGKFGLLEGRGNETRVTDLAVRIVASPPGLKRHAALVDAAQRPELFVELDKHFSRGRASDDELRAWLTTRGFIPAAAETAVRAYRETKLLLESEDDAPAQPASLAPVSPAPEPELPEPKAERPQVEAGMRRAVFGLAEGEVVITAPVFLSAESVNDLQEYLDVFMKRARREAGL